MTNTQTLFKTRRKKEAELSSETHERRKSYLSGNIKTGHSLNFPISNCSPTKICAEHCYACWGPISFKHSIIKSLSIEETIQNNIDLAVQTTTKELKRKNLDNLRYSGGGDLSEQGVEYIKKLAEENPDVVFWGFTRIPKVATELSNYKANIKVIFSLDKSTPKSILELVKVNKWKASWLYTEAGETIPKDIFIVFTNHSKGQVKDLPNVAQECPAIRNHSTGCNKCRKCIGF